MYARADHLILYRYYLVESHNSPLQHVTENGYIYGTVDETKNILIITNRYDRELRPMQHIQGNYEYRLIAHTPFS
jgi:hypothetical protein